MVVLYLLIAYILIGILFALIFLTRLIHKLDEGSIGAPWTFKLTIFPGCVVFWPVLLKKSLAVLKSDRHD